MAAFTLRIDDDIAAVIDADIQNAMPRVSRSAFIEAVLFERFRKEVVELRAQRRAETGEIGAPARTVRSIERVDASEASGSQSSN